MARKIITQVTDDIDGTEGAETVTFSVEGVSYEIDLSEKNREKFLKTVAPYIEAGTKIGGKAKGKKTDLSAVREWAAENGYEVSPRGRVPQNVLDAYNNR